VRQFRPGAIPQEVLNAILEVARWSGSASKCQHWEFVVIRERERRQALAKREGYPQERLVRTVISLGYPDEEARRARPRAANARKALSELVHWERYFS
jgi:nitroreductase